MSDEALAVIARETARDAEILGIIGELRDVFENNFDRTWFSLIIDGMPIDFRTVREIRELVSLTTIYPGEEWQLYQGVEELETFYKTVKRFLLPVLRERLGISWLFPQKRIKDPRADHPEKVRRLHLPAQPRAAAPPDGHPEGPAAFPLPLPRLRCYTPGDG